MSIFGNAKNEGLEPPKFPGIPRELAAEVAREDWHLLAAAVQTVEMSADTTDEPPLPPAIPLPPHLVQEPRRDQQAA